MNIESRPKKKKRDRSLSEYIPRDSRQQYSPLPLCNESVFFLASHYCTADEIGDLFKETEELILGNFGEAFHAGKADAILKPRMLKRDCAVLLQMFIDEYKDLVDEGVALQPNEISEVRKVFEAMIKAEGTTSVVKTQQSLNSNLSLLTDEQIRQKLEEAGYIKKE